MFRLPTQLLRQISRPRPRRSCLVLDHSNESRVAAAAGSCINLELLWLWVCGRPELSVVCEQELHIAGVNKRKKVSHGR